MPDTGRILKFDPAITPVSPVPADPVDLPDLTPAETLAELARFIRQSEQNPVTQLAGYLIADDPTYLPDCCHARALARRVGRDKLLETLIELYLNGQTPAPPSEQA
jgi:uncharacterized protein (UPF0297 family)